MPFLSRIPSLVFGLFLVASAFAADAPVAQPAQEIAFGRDTRIHWIGHPDRAATPTLSLPAPFLRTEFVVSKAVRQARLVITARGLFEAYVNGERVADDWLVPGWTDYRKRAQLLSYEVTSLIREGTNALGVILADGWYSGIGFFFREERLYGEEPSVRLRLDITYADGSFQSVASNDQWRVTTGPILSADLFDGEAYDARNELPGWSLPGYDDTRWQRAQLRDTADSESIIYQEKIFPPVRVTDRISGLSVAKGPGGEWIFDMGQNMVGVGSLKLQGRAGQRITLRFSEMLNADGSLYTGNLRNAKATDSYIFAQDGFVKWHPRFTFHGFRYVSVEGVGDDEPPLDTIEGLVLQSALKPTGSFACSDDDINQIQSNIVWGQRGNFLEVPTDCPQRDERLGWSGDAQIFARTAAFNYDVSAFFEKWMTDMRDARNQGIFVDIAPDDPLRKVSGSSPGWADAGVIVPWVMYERYGNPRILEDNYEAMKAWVDWLAHKSQPRGLLWNETGYGDWLALDKESPRNASDTNTPKSLVGTAYFAHSADILSHVASVLGHKEDAERYADLHRRVRAAFQKKFIAPDGRIAGDTQTVYLLALGFDLVPEGLRERATAHLVDNLKARNWRLSTGFIGTGLLLPVLDAVGRNDVAFKLLKQDAYPSWLFSVRQGATTLWERWNSYTSEGGFGPAHMNSFNHYAYGAVGEWIYGVLGGIRPASPGFKDILIKPIPGAGITWVNCALESPYGKIASNWQIKDGRFYLEAVIPEGSSAQIMLPDGSTHRVGAGTHRYCVSYDPTQGHD